MPDVCKVPLLAVLYHFIPEPVIVKFAIEGFAALQNVWEVEPVGASGVALIIAVTSNLEIDSQPCFPPAGRRNRGRCRCPLSDFGMF